MQTQIRLYRGIFFSKTINVQTKIRQCRGELCLKINKRACTFIRQTRVGIYLLHEFHSDFRSHNFRKRAYSAPNEIQSLTGEVARSLSPYNAIEDLR